jgi:hypothetical protein
VRGVDVAVSNFKIAIAVHSRVRVLGLSADLFQSPPINMIKLSEERQSELHHV